MALFYFTGFLLYLFSFSLFQSLVGYYSTHVDIMKKTIICIDRDGTLIHDTREHLFLGRDNDWQKKIQILPHAVEGLRLLNTIPNSGIYMITNQAGVAISDFPLLTEARAH